MVLDGDFENIKRNKISHPYTDQTLTSKLWSNNCFGNLGEIQLYILSSLVDPHIHPRSKCIGAENIHAKIDVRCYSKGYMSR